VDTSGNFDDTARGAGTDIPPSSGRSTRRAEGVARRATLAWLGAAATACDLANNTYEQFVNRGEQARAAARRRAEEARQRNAGTRDRAEDFVRTGMNVVLDNLQVPNKADVDTINVKLNILTRKIDDLQMQQTFEAERFTPEPPLTPPIVGPDGETELDI